MVDDDTNHYREATVKHIKLLFVAIGILAGAANPTPGTASEERLIPRHLLFAEPDHLAVALTGDGQRLAMIKSAGDARTVLISNTGASDPEGQVQLPAGAVPLSCAWSLDGRRLLLSCQMGKATRILAHDPAEGTTVELAAQAAGAAEIVSLSPEHSGEVLLALRGGPGKLSYWRVPTDGSEPTRILDADTLDRVHFTAAWEPRVAERVLRDGTTEVLRREGDSWKPLYVMNEDLTNGRGIPRAGVITVVGLDEEGDELFLIDNTGRDRSALVALHVETGKARVIYEDPDADLTPLPLVDRRSRKVLGVSRQFGGLHRHFFDESVKTDNDFLERHFGCGVGYVNISRDDAGWLVAPLDGGPLRFHVFQRASREVKLVGSSHSALDGTAMARRTSHVVKSRDGSPLPCQLYIAPRYDADKNGLPDQPLPTVVYIHGGPSIPAPWDLWLTNRHLQLLADRGYAVINADFRGAGGYGKEYVRKVWRQWGAATVTDVEDISSWAIDQQIARKDKIGIWGWSYGGLTTMSALAFSPDTFACGIAMYGLSDMEAFTRFVSLGPERNRIIERIGDVSNETGVAALRAQSPINSVDKLKHPILVTHGALDRVVARTHSDRFVEALEKHDKSVVYLVYPREGHDYQSPESWKSFWAVAERFLHEHLGGEFEPAGDDLREPPFQVVVGAELIPGLAGVRKSAASPPG